MDNDKMPAEIYAQGKYFESGFCKVIAHTNSFPNERNTKYIRADLSTPQNFNELLLGVLESLEAKIRQKKGFYAISVGHDETRKAHKAGVLKGLDIVQEEIKLAISNAKQKEPK